MNRKIAELVLKTWIECPVRFGNESCPKDKGEHCNGFCWSQFVVEEAVRLMLNDNKLARWIPVTERLPEDEKYYFVTFKLWGNSGYGSEYCLFKNDKWYMVADGSSEENQDWEEEITSVVAWMEKPEPYKPE